MSFKNLARQFGRIDRTDKASDVEGVTRFSEAGDTLVEVLLAVIVLGLASVALIIAFSTSISASAVHRQLATSDILLSTVSQEAIGVIESNANLNLFTSCNPQSTYVSDLSTVFTGTVTTQSGVTYTPALATNTGSIYGVEWWNPSTASFISPCTQDVNTKQPQLITVQVSYKGKLYYNSFVVDYPLASVSAQTSTGIAAGLVWTTNPSSSASTSIPFAQQPVLEVEDSSGNAVTTDLSPVIISIASGTAGQLSGCSGSEVNGIITFSGCQLDQAGTYTLTATDGSLPQAATVTVVVSGSTTPYIKFLTEPKGGASGSTFSTEPVIQVWLGASVDTAWSGTLTLSTSGGIFGPASCTSFSITNGNTAGTALSSSCLFSGGIFYDPVSGQTLAVPYTMSASATGLIPATSLTFVVSGPGPAAQLAFTTEPGGVASVSPTDVFPTQPVVDIEDAYGNVVTSSSATVSLAGTGLAGCSSTTTKGVATFTGCHGTSYGTGFTTTATAAGGLSEASTSYNITGVPASMQFTTQPVAANSGATLATQPVITIYDSSGRVVTASTTAITLSASGGSLTFCTSLAPYQGVVTVNTCNFAGTVGTPYTMTATQGAITVTSNPFSPIAPGVATQLVFATQPVAGASQSVFTTQPVIDVEDSAGNLVTNSAATLPTPTASGGALAGCTNLTAVTGVISLANCTFGGVVGTPYFMTVSAYGLGTTNSATFSPNAAGPIDQIILTGCTSDVQWNTNCTAAATIEDVYNNILLNYNSGVTFAQVSGSGAVSGLGTINASSGVASATLTGSVVGTLQVNATASAITSNSLTVTVIGIPQTVAFYTTNVYTVVTTNGSTTYGPGLTYQTYAQGSGAGIITFASTTPSICTVNGSTGLVTTVGAGTCSLTADAGPTAHYADSGATGFTLTILKATNVVTITSVAPAGAVVNGATYTATASATSGDAVVIASTTPTVCTVSGNRVSFLSVGTCTLSFSDIGNANYNAATTVTQSFNVAKGAQATLVVTSTSGNYLTPLTLTTSGGSGTGVVSYVVANGTATGCSIAAGALSATSTGTCTVTATKAADTNFLVATSAPTAVTLGKANQATLTVTSTSGTYNTPLTLTYSGGSGTGAVSFSVINGTATGCLVTGTTLTSTSAGTCSVTVKKATDANFNAQSSVATTVTLAKLANSITITSTAPVAAVNGGATYTATATATSGTAVVITSASPSVCTVSGGTVTFVGAGNCTLNFNNATTTDYLAAAQVQQIFAVAKGTQAALTLTSTSGTYNTALTMATSGGSGTGALSYTVTSGTATGCAVTTTLTSTSAGTCIVTATKAADTNFNAQTSVATTVTLVKANQAALTVSSTSGTYLTPLTLTSAGGSGTGAVSFTVTAGTASGCVITSGVLNTTSAGTCHVTAAKASDSGYNAASSSATTVTLGKANQAALTITTSTGTYLTALPIGTSGGSGTGALSFVAANGTATGCSMSGGNLNSTSTGTCLVTATKATDSNYNVVNSAQATITLGKANQATLTVTSTSGTFSTALTLTHSGGSGTGAVTYAAVNGTALGCTVNGSGPYTLTATSAGTCTVTATSATDANFNAISSTPTTVTLYGTTFWIGMGAGSATVTSASFTAPTSESNLIAIYYQSAGTVTCNTPTGTALNTFATVYVPAAAWYTTGSNYRMCVYSGEGTNVTGTITETFSGSVTNSIITDVEVTGDLNATFRLGTTTTGSSTSPTFGLLSAPATGASEFLLGALTNSSTTPPSWNNINGFNLLGQTTIGSGTTTAFVPVLYMGAPAATSLAGTISATAHWGTIGVEILP